MIEKKTFGSFIKQKRIEQNYSQKDLAEILCVTEGAVSKWERGVSYPDITLISDICHALNISEHEFITASTDTETVRQKQDAKKFRLIRGTWFWVPTISYGVTLLTCFICNIAVNHTLSWFFIVLASLICAYTFVPNVTFFFRSKKLLAFSLSTYLSVCLLLFTCAAYTGGLFWFWTAGIGVLIGYQLIFTPILLSNTKLSRYKFLISFVLALLLTILLLLNINSWHPFMLIPSILITCYAFVAPIFCTVVCIPRFDPFLKTGICVTACAILLYFVEYIVDKTFGINESAYRVNLYDWENCLDGNVQFICFVSFLILGAVFLAIGAVRAHKK